MQIDRLETKVVKPLVEYDSVCRKARVSFTFQHLSSLAVWPSVLITCRLYYVPQEELKSNHSVGEREVAKQRNLDRVRIRDPANRKRIVSTNHLAPTMHITSYQFWPTLLPMHTCTIPPFPHHTLILFQSSSPPPPGSSSLMVTFLGQRRLASFPGSLQPGNEAKRWSDDNFSVVISTPNSSGPSRLEVSVAQKSLKAWNVAC